MRRMPERSMILGLEVNLILEMRALSFGARSWSLEFSCYLSFCISSLSFLLV